MPQLASIIPGLGPISEAFAAILKFFNGVTGNFGWSVILLTIAFRIVVLPLSIKQTKSMIAMQRLQPQLKEIQKKYKDDREKMGQEMMNLYKENKVSPLGGCLPLLIQLPILFALFDVLHDPGKYIKFKTSYSFLGVKNITATGRVMWSGGKINVPKPGPYTGGEYLAVIILILLTVITGYVSSKMMTTDPRQSKLMALMPLLFGVFAWILPAGVTIYIVITNILTIIQQYVQLEIEGFYDDKYFELESNMDNLKWQKKAVFKLLRLGTKTMVALKLRKPPVRKKIKKKKESDTASRKPTGGQKKHAKGSPGNVRAAGKEHKKSSKPAVKGSDPKAGRGGYSAKPGKGDVGGKPEVTKKSSVKKKGR